MQALAAQYTPARLRPSGETTHTGPFAFVRHRSTMFISSTNEFVLVGTLCPSGQHVNWNNWTVLGLWMRIVMSFNVERQKPLGEANVSWHLHSLHARHKLSERDDFLVDAKDPSPNVGVVIVRDVINGEYWSVFLRVTAFWPKCGISLLTGGMKVQL